MEQEAYEVRYVLLTQEILCNPELNSTDKIILARATGFSKFFESSATTAQMLHLTELVVQRSKRKLIKLGYLNEVVNTGRGKILCVNWDTIHAKSNIRPNKKVTSDVTKKSYQTLQKSNIENKERINREYSTNVLGDSAESEEPKTEYGRSDINEVVELWEAETGFSLKGNQYQRRSIYNLIRRHKLERVKELVRLVGESRRVNDRFAPKIAVPSDLGGKYGKLEKLLDWDKNRKNPQPTKPTYQRPITPTIPVPTTIPDYHGANEVQDDETRANIDKQIEEARNTLKFLKRSEN